MPSEVRPGEAISILLVDDHQLVREGFASLLQTQPDLQVVGEASGGREALAKARDLLPDVILMDIQMPGGDGITATRLIKSEMPSTKVLMLTVSEGNQDLFQAISNGAQGYMRKNVAAEELFNAIREVYRGYAPISSRVAGQILSEAEAQALKDADGDRLGLAALTAREREVLREVGQGLTNREIARKLFIAENTVKIHLRNILEKLHLHNRVQAATYAHRQGLVGAREDGEVSRN